MLSVDTNVVVRFLINDEPAQFARAQALIADNDIWMAATVVLETEWVLRNVYRFRPSDFVAAVIALAGLARLQIENLEEVQRALDWHVAGMDFADALHAALADHCEAFVTFDKPCIEAAARFGLSRSRALTRRGRAGQARRANRSCGASASARRAISASYWTLSSAGKRSPNFA